MLPKLIINPKIDTNLIKKTFINLRQIVFEVTDSCNLKCKYCGYGEYYGHHDDRLNQSLSSKKAIQLLDYIKKFWQSNLGNSYNQYVYISFYGGEPLINMNFIYNVVSYIENLEVDSREFRFSLTTNGILLDKHIGYLVKKNFDLLISLDGDKNHNSYRVNFAGENSFKNVYQNIQMIRQNYPEFYRSNVSINSVIHNRNSYEEIYNYIKKKLGKIPRIAELNTTGIKEDKKEEFLNTYRNKEQSLNQSVSYEEIVEDMFYDAPKTNDLGIYLHQYSGNVFKTYNDLIFDTSKQILLPTGTCFPFSKKLFVTVNGKILPCERIGHQYTLGHVTDDRVIIDFENISKKYEYWLSKFVKQCTQCFNRKACTQCMFNIDELDEKPICKGFMNKELFKKYVNAQMSYLSENPHLYKKIMKEVLIR